MADLHVIGIDGIHSSDEMDLSEQNNSTQPDLLPLKVNNTYCSVPQCSNRPRDELSFHHFPKEVTLRKRWVQQLRIGKNVSNHMRVCSEHFNADDYFYVGPITKRRRLKKYAYPSCKLPSTTHTTVKNASNVASSSRRATRVAERTEKALRLCDIQSDCSGACDTVVEVPTDGVDRELVAAEALIELQTALTEQGNESEDVPVAEKAMTDQAACRCHSQDVVSQQQKVTLLNMIKTNSDLNAFTGIHSLTLLDSISRAAEMLQDGDSGCMNLQLDITERIVLTLVKVKLNISFKCISVLFGISITTCISYFKLTLNLLSSLMETVVVWPSKEDILKNMPTCFAKYKDTRVVLDCTETPVEKPSCLKCRLSTYSHYKGRNTIKFMVGVAPEGLITFCSAVYGGRASDKAIYLQSGLMRELIPFVDAVMSDKGFLVEPECLMSGIKLIRPPFLGKKKQFSVADGELTAEIARARVHVERSIQRFKVFRLLKTQLPWNLVAYADDIVKIVAGLVNLSNPILAMDKF